MTHLREWQRYQIAAKLEAGCTKKEIAEYLHVHPSTITREIQRNGYSRYRCYRPRIAQERAAHRWRCRHLPRRFKEDVRKKVDEMILMDYSPEQIVGVCRKQGIKMVCQYIPKGSDFTYITQEFLEEVERKLNERPRKRHGFLTPNQVLSKLTGLDARVFV